MFQSISIISLYNPLFQCFETPEMGPGIFTFSRACLNLFRNISKRLKHSDLVNFLHVSVHLNNFPIQSIVSVFQNTRNGFWYFHLFLSLFQFCFETFRNNRNIQTESIFFMFQSVSIISLYNTLFQYFETTEMGPGIFTFSRADFNFVSKRFETTETFGLKSIFFMFQTVSIISLYNPFFPCFETPEMEPGISTFSRVCFNLVWNVLKQLKHSDLSQFSSCFSLFQ